MGGRVKNKNLSRREPEPVVGDVFVLLVLLFSSIFQATFGFGIALIALPFLVNLMPLENIAPLLALVSLTIALPIVVQKRREVNVGLIKRLLVSAVVGVPLGIYLLTSLDPKIVKVALGCTVLVASLLGLFALPKDWKISPGAAYPFGFTAGVLGGAYNLSGTPLVLFMNLSHLDTQAFRASLHFFSVSLNVFVVFGYVVSGNFAPEILRFYLFSVPIVAFSLFSGNYLAKRFRSERYRTVIYGLLLVSASFLIYGSVTA